MSAAIKAPLENFLLHLLLLGAKQCIELDAMKAPLGSRRFGDVYLCAFLSLFLFVRRTGEKVKLGGLERWLRPRGWDSGFLCPA
jgi:hypothetical protein